MGLMIERIKLNYRIMRYNIKYKLKDNIKTNIKKYIKKIKDSSCFKTKVWYPNGPQVTIEPMEVVWDDKGRWKWVIETPDRWVSCEDINELDDDYNLFGEDWDDDEEVVVYENVN